MSSASPVQLTLTPLGLDPGAPGPWEAAYDRQPEPQRAGAGRGFPTLWGTPWDVFSRKLGKFMPGEALTAIVVLPLPE